MNKYLATVSFVAINRQAHHPNAARLFTDCLLGPEAQKIFGNLGEYVFQPVVDHKFKKDVKDDQIVFVKLPSAEDLESWNKKFQEMSDSFQAQGIWRAGAATDAASLTLPQRRRS